MNDLENKWEQDLVLPSENRHDRMKIFARKILHNMGIQQKNIQEEYRIEINKRKYIIDLFASVRGFTFAIECGDCKPEKIRDLKQEFSIVLHLPYEEFDLNIDETNILENIGRTLQKMAIENFKIDDIIHRIRRIERELHDLEVKIDKLSPEEIEE